MNIAGLLAYRVFSEQLPAINMEALSYWDERWARAIERLAMPYSVYGGGAQAQWSIDEAAAWARGTPVLLAMLAPRPFHRLLDSGAAIALIRDSARWSPLEGDEDDHSPEAWDEAIELSDESLLVYPQDASDAPYLGFYTTLPLRRPLEFDEPVRVGTLAVPLLAAAAVGAPRVFIDSDGSCERWLVVDGDSRDIECQAAGCPRGCSRRVTVLRGGVREARCAC